MEQAYAQALWKMVEEGMAPSKAVQSLSEILKQHGRLALMPRIGKAFERIAARELSKSRITLSVAREKDERSAKAAAKEVLSALKLDAKDIALEVDDSLIGGWSLEGSEILMDRSYKTRLLEIFKKVVA
ncbi:MAG TPA: F0F1 ATP synthase subunit delta [Candidatus Paceibacterota bacterium]|nr:F0F1 ATP synthase subunit delta [Candidatus Paceibacterota bacterium]